MCKEEIDLVRVKYFYAPPSRHQAIKNVLMIYENIYLRKIFWRVFFVFSFFIKKFDKVMPKAWMARDASYMVIFLMLFSLQCNDVRSLSHRK
jgi:hypothetical protein